MKTNLKALPLAVAAGTLAMAIGGCGTFDHRDRSADRASERHSERSADRTADRSSNRMAERRTVETTTTTTVSTNTPAVVDPFSSRYVPFPGMTNESAGVIGHSMYCAQHYNQPGCQTFDSAANDRSLRHDRPMRRSDAGDFRSDMNGVPNRN